MTTTPAPPLDLKNLRLRAKLTQKHLADLLDVDQSQISRWEASPESLPLVLVLSLSRVLGLTVDEMLTGTELEADLAPQVDPTARQGLERFAELVAGVGRSFNGLGELAAASGLKGPAEVDHLAAATTRKPRVLVIGPFDGGKSTFVNTLLQSRTLAVRYQPTTSLVTVLRHEDDRPAWLQAPTADWLAQNIGQIPPVVLIMRRGFDVARLEDEEHVRAYYLTAGGLDLLAEVGTHGADRGLDDATCAVAFLDAEILKVCDLIDTPGSDASDSDDHLVESTRQTAQVLVHLSPVTGFLSANQISYLLPSIRSLAPYNDVPATDRVYLVASHAHGGIAEAELAEALGGAATRLAVSMLADTEEEGEQDAASSTTEANPWSPERTRDRMFAFYDSNGNDSGRSRGETLLQDLTMLLADRLPRTATQHLCDQLTNSVDAFMNQLERQVGALEAAEDASTQLPDLEQAAREVQDAVNASRKKLRDAVDGHRQRSIAELGDAFHRRLNVARTERLIRSRYNKEAFLAAGREKVDPKKAAQEEVGALLLSRLQNDLAIILGRESRQFGKTIDSELDALAIRIEVAGGFSQIPYDLRGAFVGGALGTAAVGALAVWASTLGNLGAYIIAAQAAGWLSAVGISLPAGGATLTTAMAAFGGPVGVAIAIIAIGVLFGFMFRSDWEARLAKAVVKGFDRRAKGRDKTIHQLLEEIVKNYWDDTQSSVEVGLANVVEAHRSELQRFRDMIGDDVDNTAKRQARRVLLADLQQYFQDLLTAVRISQATDLNSRLRT